MLYVKTQEEKQVKVKKLYKSLMKRRLQFNNCEWSGIVGTLYVCQSLNSIVVFRSWNCLKCPQYDPIHTNREYPMLYRFGSFTTTALSRTGPSCTISPPRARGPPGPGGWWPGRGTCSPGKGCSPTPWPAESGTVKFGVNTHVWIHKRKQVELVTWSYWQFLHFL